MKQILHNKTYQLKKNKSYIKTNKLFFFFNGVNLSSTNKLVTEQTFKKKNLECSKIFNKILIIVLNNSIYLNLNTVVSGILFLVKLKNSMCNLNKKTLFNDFKTLLFLCVAIKLNNKFYSINQIKKINNLNYIDNKLLFFNFLNANFKFFTKKIKNRNDVI